MENRYIVHGPTGSYVEVSYRYLFQDTLSKLLPKEYHLTSLPGIADRNVGSITLKEKSTPKKCKVILNELFTEAFPRFFKSLVGKEKAVEEVTANPELLDRVPDTDEVFRGSLGKLRKVAEERADFYNKEVDRLMGLLETAKAGSEKYGSIIRHLVDIGNKFEKTLCEKAQQTSE